MAEDEAETTLRAVPRAASDAFRAWVSVVVLIPATAVITAGIVLATVLGGYEVDKTALQFFFFLVAYALYFAWYEVWTWRTFSRLDAAQLGATLRASEPRRLLSRIARFAAGGGALSWSVSSATFALTAALVVAFVPALRSEPLVLVGAAVLVVTSWLVIPTTFAVQYARQHQRDPGLRFPGDREPVLADFFYLAVQVSTTFATSDVTVVNTSMRRRVTAHSLIAFAFNSAVIALVVSAVLLAAPTS